MCWVLKQWQGNPPPPGMHRPVRLTRVPVAQTPEIPCTRKPHVGSWNRHLRFCVAGINISSGMVGLMCFRSKSRQSGGQGGGALYSLQIEELRPMVTPGACIPASGSRATIGQSWLGAGKKSRPAQRSEIGCKRIRPEGRECCGVCYLGLSWASNLN